MSIDDPAERSESTIHAVALSHEQTAMMARIAGEVAGRFRSYVSPGELPALLPESGTGCLLIGPGRQNNCDPRLVEQLTRRYPVLPVIVLQQSIKIPRVVSLMQHGAYSVLTEQSGYESIQGTLEAAVDLSHRRRKHVDADQDASLRMQEATAKEREVLDLIMDGQKNKEIAAALGITVRAVEDRRFRLMKKVKAQSIAELVATAVRAEFHDDWRGRH